MRHDALVLEVPSVLNAAGASLRVDRYTMKTVQFHGAFNGGTFKLQGKIAVNPTMVKLGAPAEPPGPSDSEHDDWTDLTGNITAPAWAVVGSNSTDLHEYACSHIRVFCVVAPAGAPPRATFGGQDTRTD